MGYSVIRSADHGVGYRNCNHQSIRKNRERGRKREEMSKNVKEASNQLDQMGETCSVCFSFSANELNQLTEEKSCNWIIAHRSSTL